MTDLKPYGVKDQWGLMPFESLVLTDISHLMAEYQRRPSVQTAIPLAVACRYACAGWGSRGKEILRVLEHGAEKYEPDNWKSIEWTDASRLEYVSALMRHYDALCNRQLMDPDSGLSHAAHMACNAFFILWHEIQDAPA